jgi:hypothetical protein
VSFVPSQRLQSVNPGGTETVNMVSKRSARLFSKVLFERLCTNVPTSRKSGNWPVYDAGDVDGDELGFDAVHEQSTADSGASATVRAAAANASTAGFDGTATATAATAGASTAGMSRGDSTATLPAGAAERRSCSNASGGSSRSTASSSANNSSCDAAETAAQQQQLLQAHTKPRYMSAAQAARLAATAAADPCTPPLLPTLDAQQAQLQAQLQQLQLSPGSVEAGLRVPAPFHSTVGASASVVRGATVAANGDVIGTVPLTGSTAAAAGSTQQVRQVNYITVR